jgi:ATP-dependent Clp protease adaptor protein ClpS
MIDPTSGSQTVLEKQTETVLALEGQWNVVVLSDPVNLASYVVLVFRRVLGFDEATAHRHMIEAHEKGRSVVWMGGREKAEAYVYSLQEWHLSAILEKDAQH